MLDAKFWHKLCRLLNTDCSMIIMIDDDVFDDDKDKIEYWNDDNNDQDR